MTATAPTSRRLLVIEPLPVVQAGLRALLGAGGPGLELDCTGSFAEGCARAATGPCSGALVDPATGEEPLEALLPRLERARPGLPILVFTALPRNRLLPASAGPGRVFVPKRASAERLLDALQTVLAGRLLEGSAAEPAAADEGVGAGRSVLRRLSAREREVLALLALGLSMAEIGARLRISPKTAHAHRSNILNKLGFADNQALARYAFEHGLIRGRRAADQAGERGAESSGAD